jgi:hypothetical protein
MFVISMKVKRSVVGRDTDKEKSRPSVRYKILLGDQVV